jgi:hypothetical protein
MDRIEVVKETCHQFLMTAVEETEKRLFPEGTYRGHLSKMSQLYPKNILNLEQPVQVLNLPYQQLIGDKRSEIESQLRMARHVDWKQELQFSSVPEDPVVFWGKVRSYRDPAGFSPCFDLADYILTCVAAPTSNAFIERIFSMVAYVKDKYSNQLSIDMLDSTLRVKSFLHATSAILL